MSVPVARDRSVMATTVWSKMSLPLPASLRMFLNVRRKLAPSWIDSASDAVRFSSEPARSSTCLAETPAAPPVDRMTVAVWELIRSMRWRLLTESLTNLVTAPAEMSARAGPMTDLRPEVKEPPNERDASRPTPVNWRLMSRCAPPIDGTSS